MHQSFPADRALRAVWAIVLAGSPMFRGLSVQVRDGADRWLGLARSPADQEAEVLARAFVPPGQWCRRCGRVPPGWPLGEAGQPVWIEDSCGCRPLGNDVVILGRDAGPLGQRVRQIKHRGGWGELGLALGRRLGTRVRDIAAAEPGVLVVPMPASPVRRAARGIDHGRVIAAGVADGVGGRLVPGVLEHRGGRRQAGMTAAERSERGNSVIQAGRRAQARIPSGATVVLVDDLRTTGATLAAAVECLLASGAGWVVVAVLVTRDAMEGRDGALSPAETRGAIFSD
ncbi:MAG: ComF family protein [Phycisphaerales bacterium]